MKTRISVVAPCKDDIEILNMITSIDISDVEVVIVFNGSSSKFISEVLKRAKDCKQEINTYNLPQPNLALALEYGTRMAKNNLILYMDSDCRFKRDALNSFLLTEEIHDQALNVYKGRVVFQPGTSKIEKIIASSRDHHTAEVLTAYKPPLLISKKIIPKIGGYVFNEKLIWREDADLDNRIRKANISIIPVEEGVIYHRAISLKTDLRSTYRYGIGLAIADVLRIKLTEVPRSTMSAFRSKGLAVACYMFFRNRVYNAGYLQARIRLIFGRYA